jgi:hypothetical protein
MKTKNNLLLILGILILFSCGDNKEMQTKNTATIYFGGDIITMVGETAQYTESVTVKDGKIRFVGKYKDAIKRAGEGYQTINLEGKTLMPSFIDPHSHFINSLGMSSQANCSPSPVGEANNVSGIIKALKNLKVDKNIPDGELIMGYGYDDTVMPDGKLLNRDDLDKAFPNNPVMVLHVSLHGAVLNSESLSKFGISDKTETPPGGVIVRKPGTKEPYGLIMETAFLPVFAQFPKPTAKQIMQQLKDGQMIYAAAGVTTAQEGASHLGDVQILQTGADSNAFFIDVVSYPFITEFDTIFKLYSANDFGKYTNNFKLGGIKITIDGSPQGRTALFTTPYLTGGPSGEENWLGKSTFTQEEVNQMLKGVYDKGLQSIFHANGDGAIYVFKGA